MELRKYTKRITTYTLALAAVLGSVVPVQATILHGYVEEAGSTAPIQSDSKSGANEAPLANSYPTTYAGDWHCVTTVVDSGVATVPAGLTMASDVQFARTADGRITANWKQPGWTETQASVTIFSAVEARVDRTNYYVADGVQGSWAARSRDQYTQIAPSAIVAKSYVDQYQDGQFIGRYRTTSVLKKQGADLAYNPQ